MISIEEFGKFFGLDLDPVRIKLMHESGEGWSPARAAAVETEYRRFLYLMKTFPQEHTSPTIDVDTFWHYHILDTVKYAADCQYLFGYFLHHFPYVGMRGDDDLAALGRMGDRMAELYQDTFGIAYPGTAQVTTQVARSEEAAFCAATQSPAQVDAAFCAATETAQRAEAAFCATTQAAPRAEAAFCATTQAAPRAEAAFCATTQAAPRAEAAFCAATQAAFCAATGVPARAQAAFCAAAQPATGAEAAFFASIHSAATGSLAAFCATAQAPARPQAEGAAFCASAPAFCAAKAESHRDRIAAVQESPGFYSVRPALPR